MSKVCPKCGCQVDDNAEFCEVCGSPVNPPANPAEPGQTQQPQTNGSHVWRTDEGNAAAKTVVTKFCGSPGVLIFTMIMTVWAILAIINDLTDFTWFSVVEVILFIPAIIICIACWVIYGRSRGNTLTGHDFTLISGSLLTYMILSIIASAAVGVILVLLVVMVTNSSFLDTILNFVGDLDSNFNANEIETDLRDAGAAIAVVIAVVAVIAIVVFVLYYNGLRRSCKTGRDIMDGNGTHWRASVFSIIVLIIVAIFSIVSMFDYYDGILPLLEDIFYAVMIIFSIVFLFMVRSKGKRMLR